MSLANSTVSGNRAGGVGGGVLAVEASLTNCTVSGNTARVLGGGIAAPTATLSNCTVAENLANTGGGLFHMPPGGAFILTNTIVPLNLVQPGRNSPGVAGDVSTVFTSRGHNLIGDGTGGNGFTHGDNGDIVGTSLNPIDPKLRPLANNGGPTKTHALLRGSPAIDLGINDALATLTAAIAAKATTLLGSNTAPFVPGMRLRLGNEVVVVVSVNSGNSTLTVRRGVSGTRTAHAAGTGLFLVTDQRGLGFARKEDGNGDIGAFER